MDWKEFGALGLMTVLMVMNPVMVKLSIITSEDQKLPYDPRVATLYMELLKLIYTVSVMAKNDELHLLRSSKIKMTGLYFFVPSLLYIIHNWLVYLVMGSITPATFQLLGQMRIPLTSWLHFVVADRTPTVLKVIGLGLLLVGVMVALSTCDDLFLPSFEEFTYVLVICMLSAAAGVYTEKLLKSDFSLNQLNFFLYSWGIFSSSLLFVGNPPLDLTPFYKGFTLFPILAVLTFAFVGLVISFVMKHFDIILKLFAGGISIVLVVVVDVLFFGMSFTLTLALGTVVVLVATVLFYSPPAKLEEPVFGK